MTTSTNPESRITREWVEWIARLLIVGLSTLTWWSVNSRFETSRQVRAEDLERYERDKAELKRSIEDLSSSVYGLWQSQAEIAREQAETNGYLRRFALDHDSRK